MNFVVEARRKLDELRRHDPEFRIFGSGTHRYVLRPPIADSELSRAEANLRITLPARIGRRGGRTPAAIPMPPKDENESAFVGASVRKR
jgi:hypothetical protein